MIIWLVLILAVCATYFFGDRLFNVGEQNFAYWVLACTGGLWLIVMIVYRRLHRRPPSASDPFRANDRLDKMELRMAIEDATRRKETDK